MSKNTKINSEKIKSYKKSAFAELGFASSTIIALMALVVIVCIVIFGIMLQSPSKKVVVQDDAGIFSSREIDEITRLAKKLSKRDDINVIIVTTRDKEDTIHDRSASYSNSDSDCARFAGDYYAKKAIKHNFRDNSGICILVDVTLDYSGGRFFWLYTYGTAYYAISDDEAQDIFRSNRMHLANGYYGEAIINVLDDVSDHDFNGFGVKFLSSLVFIIPLVAAALAVLGITYSRKLDKVPESNVYLTYSDRSGFKDIFERDTVSVTHVSSSSGGGGGGGGFSGGGHSGGGGGRF